MCGGVKPSCGRENKMHGAQEQITSAARVCGGYPFRLHGRQGDLRPSRVGRGTAGEQYAGCLEAAVLTGDMEGRGAVGGTEKIGGDAVQLGLGLGLWLGGIL